MLVECQIQYLLFLMLIFKSNKIVNKYDAMSVAHDMHRRRSYKHRQTNKHPVTSI